MHPAHSFFASASLHGIRLKLSAAFIAVSLVMGGFVVGAFNMQLATLERAALLEAERFAGVIAYSGAENALSRPEYMQSYIDALHAVHGRDIAFVDVGKKGIADAHKDAIGAVFAEDRNNEVGRTILDGRARTFIEQNKRHPQGTKQAVVALHASQGNPMSPIVGAAIIEYSPIYDGLLASEERNLYLLGAFGMVCVLLSAWLGLRMAARMARRLKSLQDGVDIIAGGDYDTRVSIASRDEFGRLGAAFNGMAEALRSSHAKLVKYGRGLEKVVAARTQELTQANTRLEREVDDRVKAADDATRFRAAMDISGDAIFLLDRARMCYLDVNQTYCDLFGYTRNEVLGMTPMALFGADRETMERHYDEIIADTTGGVIMLEQHLRKDGALVPIETRRRALHTKDGWLIVGTAHDITGRKRAELELRASEARFRSLSKLSADWYWEQDEEFRFIDFSGGIHVPGWGPEQPGALGLRRWELPGAQAASGSWAEHKALLETHAPFRNFEYQHTRVDGARQYLSASGEAVFDAGGRFTGYRGVASDIAERKEAELRIKRLNRVHAVLSGINTLIVRVKDRGELFDGACRIAVETGAFRLAWIGVVEPHGMQITPVASAGPVKDYMQHLRLAIEDTQAGRGLPGQAVRGNKAVIVNDIATDARMLLRDEAAKRGFRSLVLLPLSVSGEVAGVLGLYADAAGFFDDDEMKLLQELAGDISFALEHIEKAARIEYLAYYDVLTGLANRALFHERLSSLVGVAGGEGRGLAVLVVDIERFRTINETFGRQAGDAVLKEFADRARRHITDVKWLARIGPDQFASMIPDVANEGAARRIEQRLTEVLGEPFRLGEAEMRVSVKIGIALYPADGADADALLRNAEAALKKAKATGERYLFYTPEMTARVAENLALENRLRQAIENEEFVLHYQPKVSLANGKVTSAEGLIRWNDPRTGLVPPGHFIPILEETGLIHEVGRWALRKAVEDYLRWRNAGLPAVRMAVNVSPLQLRNRAFIDEVRQAIGVDANAAAGLELEITESLIMADVEHSIASLQAIRAMGVKIAIDDFGTGFSSLSYLARLPVDTLKIDRTFVVDMTVGPQGLALVSTIINLAHSLKLDVVAEGVETEEQARLLRLLGCDEMQGFLFSRPVPGDTFEASYLSRPAVNAAAALR